MQLKTSILHKATVFYNLVSNDSREKRHIFDSTKCVSFKIILNKHFLLFIIYNMAPVFTEAIAYN